MLKKKIIAALAALAVAATVTGCADMSKIMTVEGEGLNAGVYINYMLSQYTTLKYYSSYFSSSTDSDTDFLDQTYSDDQTYGEYIESYAMEQTLRGVAADKLFKEEGLELTDDQLDEIDSYTDSYVSSMTEDYLEEQGVSTESVKIMYTYQEEEEALFEHYYYEGGTKEVTDDDVKTYLSENYLRYKQIKIQRTAEENSDGSDITDEQEEAAETAAKETADRYLALAQESGADGFDELIEQYSEETATTTEATTEEETTEEATEAEEETAEEATESEEEAAEEETTEEETTEEETTYDTSAAYTVTFYDGSGEAYDEDSDYPPVEVNGGDTVSRPETDPEKLYYDFDGWYADSSGSTEFDFDTPISADTEVYAIFSTNENLTQYSEDDATNLQKAIYEMEAGSIELQSDDDYYYIILKLDASAREDYLRGGDNNLSFIQTMKSDEFNTTLDEKAEEMDIDKNESAVKKYTAEKIDEKYNNYQS